MGGDRAGGGRGPREGSPPRGRLRGRRSRRGAEGEDPSPARWCLLRSHSHARWRHRARPRDSQRGTRWFREFLHLRSRECGGGGSHRGGSHREACPPVPPRGVPFVHLPRYPRRGRVSRDGTLRVDRVRDPTRGPRDPRHGRDGSSLGLRRRHLYSLRDGGGLEVGRELQSQRNLYPQRGLPRRCVRSMGVSRVPHAGPPFGSLPPRDVRLSDDP